MDMYTICMERHHCEKANPRVGKKLTGCQPANLSWALFVKWLKYHMHNVSYDARGTMIFFYHQGVCMVVDDWLALIEFQDIYKNHDDVGHLVHLRSP